MDMNVAQLLRDPVGATREFLIDELVNIADDGKSHPIHGGGSLIRTQRSILVRCSLDTEVELTCSRCLRQYLHLLKIEFEEEFFPTLDILSGMPLPQAAGSDNFTIDERHTLDLTEAVRQYIIMALPMKALCKEDCQGLCPVCGKNLNEGPCHCPAPGIDPRWSKLVGLE